MSSRWLTNDAVGTAKADPTLAGKVKQAYSDVTANGSQLTFSTVGGDSKSVSVTGGAGGSVTAFNGATLNTSTNEVTFSSTTGASADEVVLDLDPMLTSLESTVGGHTTEIDEVKETLGFEGIVKHPPLTNAEMWSSSVTVNGKTYEFYHSSGSDPNYYHRFGFMDNTQNKYWYSNQHANNIYNVASGSYYEYGGTVNLGGIDGEYLQIKLPDPVLITNFTMSGAANENLPRSFKLLASNDGTNYEILGEYDDVTVSTTDEGSNFKIDSGKGIYYNWFAIVVTKIDKIGSDDNVAIRWLRYYTPPDIITKVPRNDSSFYDATITGTNTLNLISNSGTTQ